MSTNKPNIKKSKKYIYTEADLGEGLLDAGVVYPCEMTTTFNQEDCIEKEEPGDQNIDGYLSSKPMLHNNTVHTYYC